MKTLVQGNIKSKRLLKIRARRHIHQLQNYQNCEVLEIEMRVLRIYKNRKLLGSYAQRDTLKVKRRCRSL